MPNFEFYAVNNDVLELLKFFKEKDYVICESHSAPDQNLRFFESPGEAFGVYKAKQFDSIALQIALWHTSMKAKAQVEKIDFTPGEFRDHTHRYSIQGWGLLYFIFGGLKDNVVFRSNLGYNSEKRVAKLDVALTELGARSDWNWGVVENSASEIQKQIRKLSAGKEGFRPLLPDAFHLFKDGYELRNAF